MLGNNFPKALFHLGVAVRAEQNAFGRLGAQMVDGHPKSPSTQLECLARGIDMVEVQRADASVIAAQTAGAARLLNELPLDELAATGDGLRRAACAPPGAVGAKDVHGGSVPDADTEALIQSAAR